MPITINNKTGALTGIDAITGTGTANLIPTGMIQMYTGTAAPTGWVICNGTAISRSTFASLFTVCSTTFGSGDGSTTFNVPDFRGRLPIGVGTGSGLTARTLGSNYGAETVTLSSSNIPTLTTGNNSATHTHDCRKTGGNVYSDGIYGFSAVGGGYKGNLIIQGNDGGTNASTSGVSANHTHSYTNGSLSSVAILDPSLTINFIIKT
jgi:microcystin-dependent protein